MKTQRTLPKARVDNITGDNVRPEDKDALKNAERELEELLNNFDGNYTAGERSELEDRLDTVRDALKSIENAENAEKKIGSLPETGSVRLKDKDRVNEAVDAVNKLSDNERAILDRELTEKLDGLVKRIAELEKISYNPSVISGAGQEWRSGFAQGAKFISNAERDEFLHVLVDGRELDRKHYTVSDGISEVLLKSEYLETLKTGKHTLTIQFVNGSAVTEFTVMRDAVSPVTGDGSHTSLWLFLVSVSGCAATGMFISIRKKKKYKDIRG